MLLYQKKIFNKKINTVTKKVYIATTYTQNLNLLQKNIKFLKDCLYDSTENVRQEIDVKQLKEVITNLYHFLYGNQQNKRQFKGVIYKQLKELYDSAFNFEHDFCIPLIFSDMKQFKSFVKRINSAFMWNNRDYLEKKASICLSELNNIAFAVKALKDPFYNLPEILKNSYPVFQLMSEKIEELKTKELKLNIEDETIDFITNYLIMCNKCAIDKDLSNSLNQNPLQAVASLDNALQLSFFKIKSQAASTIAYKVYDQLKKLGSQQEYIQAISQKDVFSILIAIWEYFKSLLIQKTSPEIKPPHNIEAFKKGVKEVLLNELKSNFIDRVNIL